MSLNKISINDTTTVNTGVVYDITKATSQSYDTLSAALGTDGNNVPPEVREGGMSIRFISNSDNKYVQYRLMTDEFTTDTTQWAIADESVYVENPEFIRCYCDADDRLLWWIYPDGSVDWAKGVPTPIQEELKKLEQLIKDNAEGDESVVARVTANEASIVAINKYLDETIGYEDSPEYIKVEKDDDGRILNGIKTDGTNYMPKTDIDTLSLEGKEVDNDSVLAHKYIESPEFIKYYCDADGRLIWWIYPDGSIDWAKGVPQPIQEELKKLEQRITDSIGFGNNYNLIDRHSGKQSDYIYSSGYFGYRTTVNSKSIIQSISFSMWKDTDENYPSTIEVVIGEIDQRNWLLPRTTVIADVTLNNNVLTAKLRKTTFINENEVVFIHVTQKRNITLKLTDEVVDINNRGCYTSSLDSAIREVNTNRDFSYYIVSLTEYTGDFVTTSEIETIDTKIKLLSNETSKINKYTDVVTGEKYKIRIANGEIKLVSNNYKSLLVISHSFGNYLNSPSADWYLDNGENRAMAPSVYDKEFSWFLTQALGLSSWKRLSGVEWERNYTNFDFEAKWALQDTWDAIVVFLGENMQTTEGLSEAAEKAMLYLLKACPSAEIFWCTCWQSNKAEKYIEAATNVPDITLVNTLKSGVDNNRWKKGDYYIGRDSIYYPIGAPYSHPNDMGHLMIAKEILDAMGKSDNTPIYKITLTQTDGGIIETPNVDWLAGSVVTIRCKATEGNYINAVSVSASNGETIQATLRVNSFGVYYTFIMPETDVSITPTWSNTKNYTTYNVSVSDTSGGTLTILNSTTLEGTRVYVYAKPSDGKSLGSISASTNSEQIQLIADGNNTYYFTMPANNVVITPIWE